MIGDVYNNLASVYINNEPDSALLFLNKTLAINKILGNAHALAALYGNIAGIYNTKHNYKTAIVFANKANSIAQKINNTQVQANASNELCTSYEALGNYSQALHYHKIYKQLNDSMFSSEF